MQSMNGAEVNNEFGAAQTKTLKVTIKKSQTKEPPPEAVYTPTPPPMPPPKWLKSKRPKDMKFRQRELAWEEGEDEQAYIQKCKLFVGMLPFSSTQGDILALFSSVGTV